MPQLIKGTKAVRRCELEKRSPDLDSYDPRNEQEKRASEERKGIEAEFDNRARTREDGSSAGDGQRGGLEG